MLFDKFEQFLIKTNCKKNDIILIHSDISNLEGASWIEKCNLLNNFINSYFQKDSTLLFPSFTYSFCKTGVFDKKKTPSEVGIFDEYIRNQRDYERSDHPIFSFSVKGKFKNLFMNNSNSCSGDGSVFEKLYTFDAKILFLGCRFITSSTFLHFVEQKNMVPYRYSKIFFPRYKMKYPNYEYYVTAKEKFKFDNRKKELQIEKDLLSKQILKRTKINNFNILICSARNVFDFVSKKIKKNPYYILGKPPKII